GWSMKNHKRAEGGLFGVYCVRAGMERFVVEFFRAKDDRFGWAFGLSTAQLIAIGIAVTGIVWMRLRAGTGPGRSGILAVPTLGLALASGCLSQSRMGDDNRAHTM